MSLEADPGKLNLNGAGVLITRPLEQSSGMEELVTTHGGVAFVFPGLAITLKPYEELNSDLARVCAGDVLIFVSTNAVRGVFHDIDVKRQQQLSSAQVAAVGERTRAALEAENLFVAISPGHGQQNSEGLLSHPLLQDLAGRHVFIVRGQSGRETLRDTLLERGAQLNYIEAYTRSIPRDFDSEPVLEAFAAGQIQYVMLTSFAAFENIHQMLGEQVDSVLGGVELVVPGARVAQKIRDRYPFTIREAENASDREMLRACQ